MVKRIGVVVFNDNFNTFKDVIEILQENIGYPKAQAEQCAHQIHNKGSYLVKSFPIKDRDIADEVVDLLIDNGLIAKLISYSEKP